MQQAVTARKAVERLFDYNLPVPRCGGRFRKGKTDIFFTGWKSFYDGFALETLSPDAEIDLDLENTEPVFVGQWVWYNPDDTSKNIYVNLPGMEHGYFPRGGSYDIGTKRVTRATSVDELETLALEGLVLLRKLIDKHEGTLGARQL